MTASRAECVSCGSRRSETRFPTIHRRGDPVLCWDCLGWPAEAARLAATRAEVRGRILTRASYRAALRWRQGSAQGDLVDLVVPPP